MNKNTVVELGGRDTIADPLTQMLRTGAQRLITKAVELELQELLEQHASEHPVVQAALDLFGGEIRTVKRD